MPHFQIINLDYHSNLTTSYQKLAYLPGFVLLQSSDKLTGRYDILSAFPYEKIKISADNFATEQSLQGLKEQLAPIAAVCDLPFQGGAIGYFSYDWAAKLAGIQSPAQANLRTMPLLELGLYDWAIISDHQLKKVSLFAANSREETPAIVDEILERWHSNSSVQAAFSLKSPFVPLYTKSAYQDSFAAIHQDLRAGRAYQVNYTQPFHAAYVGEPWEMYKQVNLKNPVPYAAYFRLEDAFIMSFSPERFILMDKGRLLTSPIKGTERRSMDPSEDKRLRQALSDSPKNRAENIMIVDLLRNDLGRIAQAGSVRVKSLCSIESYQAVHHLVSHIEAQCLTELSTLDAFMACFPGGSITGAPKLESMRIIAEQEVFARGVYCGSLGYFSRHGRFDTNIAIRTITARNDCLHLAAGGGLVIDSNWEDEYRECFTKIAAIVNGLGSRARSS